MAVGRLVGWLVGVVVCAPLVLCAGNQGVSRLYKRHGPAKYRPVSRGSHYLRFNYFPLSGFAASRILPRGVSLLSASISLSSSNVSSLFFFSLARPFAPPTFVSATSFFVPRASLFFASVRFDRFFFFFLFRAWSHTVTSVSERIIIFAVQLSRASFRETVNVR